MSTGTAAVLKDQAAERRVPGEPGVWVLIAGEALVFSLFFVLLVRLLAQHPALYAQSQAGLSRNFGLLNTMLMLASSWFVAAAVVAARQGHQRLMRIRLFGAAALGVAFAVAKGFEWRAKIEAGITIQSNDFFALYYSFTAIHLAHVLLGTGMLVFLAQRRTAATPGTEGYTLLESGACFWHLVDLLWIGLFAILYLLH